jgi:cytochrome P450 family 109
MSHTARNSPEYALSLPKTVAEISDLFDQFAELRERSPVLRAERMPLPPYDVTAYHVFGYEDVCTALTDHARFTSSGNAVPGSLIADTVVVTDPPDHRKLRNLVSLAFTPAAVARLEDRMVAIVRETIDRVGPTGTMDVVADLAFPLPARVIAHMLGVPEERWDAFGRDDQVDAAGQRPDRATMLAARERFREYFGGLVDERRRDPHEDLISTLAVAEVDGEALTTQQIVNFCYLLLVAGQDSTRSLIATTLFLLAERPEVQRELIAEPDLVPAAIEEALRYLPPNWFGVRRTSAEVRLGDSVIPAGQLVIPWFTSANHDPSQFADPDRLDLRREPNRHITFGHGVHYCLGAPLARVEARIAITMLLQELGTIRLVEGVPIGVDDNLLFNLRNVPVTFAAR